MRRFPHFLMDVIYKIAQIGLTWLNHIIPIRKKSIIFVSLGGRNYDDSPRTLYEYIVNRKEFIGWTFVWAFRNPENYVIPKATSIKFGTISYWKTLLSSYVWISNGGIDRGLDLVLHGHIHVNTWHGTPIKKIQGEESANPTLKLYRNSRPIDKTTIRCCQSEYDKKIFARVFRASEECFIMNGLPRNDKLLSYSRQEIQQIKQTLGIPQDKKVILYMPTYREYLMNVALAIPMDVNKWETSLSNEYVLLVRSHYAKHLTLLASNGDFIKDVSYYTPLTDLYAISDILVSDYSSAFFDFSILGRPMRSFAYDIDRYKQERGFYIDIENELPCPIHKNEDDLIKSIVNIDVEADSAATRIFAKKYIPHEGVACSAVTEELIKRIKNEKQ